MRSVAELHHAILATVEPELASGERLSQGIALAALAQALGVAVGITSSQPGEHYERQLQLTASIIVRFAELTRDEIYALAQTRPS
jgi:hypothetical protein